jgi:hypothetical protein
MPYSADDPEQGYVGDPSTPDGWTNEKNDGCYDLRRDAHI